MKTIPKLLAVLITTSAFSYQVAQATELTDAQALAEGMTPIEEILAQRSTDKSLNTNNPQIQDINDAIASNALVILINKRASGANAQTMKIFENGIEIHQSLVSTGREKTERATSGRTYLSTTPKGFFRPTKVYRDYLSYTWNAPMPNSVFFIGGIAIHAAAKNAYANLGQRASGGCVRATLENSLLVREKVMNSGRGVMAGMFKVINEAKGRNRITNNSISVPAINRSTGQKLKSQLNSWDTIIIVHDQDQI